jgi:hypothetical protein
MLSRFHISLSLAALLVTIVIVGGTAALLPLALESSTLSTLPAWIPGSYRKLIAGPAEVTTRTRDVAQSTIPNAAAVESARVTPDPAAIEWLNATHSLLVERGELVSLETLEPIESFVVLGTSPEDVFDLSGSWLPSNPVFRNSARGGAVGAGGGGSLGSGGVGLGGRAPGSAIPRVGSARSDSGGAVPAHAESLRAASGTMAGVFEARIEDLSARHGTLNPGRFDRDDGFRYERDEGSDYDFNNGHHRGRDDLRDADESLRKPGDGPSRPGRTSVPEPSSLLLTGTGLVCLASMVRRRTGR